ncbi:uncharacterized protein LDX57_011432 [Aspergillus melleus]|uniref:uncharacterized protein n=1 Tax=Aspergillus melleus TaxID=138277 RepID=UPI001E8D18CB|nr:uncharacterized protein LDX57_011432 [Aspergillus melleus]KAH8433798.1 hypothetical protein LDX57_011432 [Aspergillus melleus]
MLQRCNSSRLDRLGVVVGWRKGDAASLMAKSAGGQAIALLAVALSSLCNNGDVLLGLSQKLLPASLTLASGYQLGEVAKRLSTKLAPLGFGNVLAQQVSRIYDAYKHLQKPMPADIIAVMTTESVVDLLYAISRALLEEDRVVRISGTRSMGYIAALVMFMFPQDCQVTVDDNIIFSGPKKTILVELGNGEEEHPTEIRNETIWRISQATPSPIIIKPREPRVADEAGFFTWEGYVADRLQLDFFDQGVKCTEELFIAIAGLLLLLPAQMQGAIARQGGRPFPRKGLIALLGNHPKYRMSKACQKILRIPPIEPPSDFEEALKALVGVFQSVSEPHVSCTCSSTTSKCNPSLGWESSSVLTRKCEFSNLWLSVGRALDTGLLAFFVEAGTNAVTSDTFGRAAYSLGMATRFVTKKLKRETFFTTFREIHQDVLRLAGRYLGRSEELACSESSTVYSSVLETMSLDRDRGATYYLVDGQLLFNGHYHSKLCAFSAPDRPRANESIYAHNGVVKPSRAGEHMDLLFTVHERSSHLELTCTARFSGSTVRLQLSRLILASYDLEESEPCAHSPTRQLSLDKAKNIMTTSVAAPRAQKDKIAIVQTARNETAQLLSCELGVQTILQKQSCLDCAYDQAIGKYEMIIVA